MQNQKGFTLAEALVTLAILAIVTAGSVLISVNIVEKNERKSFEKECVLLSDKIQSAKDAAIMLDDPRGTLCDIRGNKLVTTTYEYGKQIKKTDSFPHLYVENTSIAFSRKGVITKGSSTITLVPKSGAPKYLVVQIDTGRIYLTDTKPKK